MGVSYKEITKIQEIIWRSDDMMMQEDLFELQEYVANLALKAAKEEGKVDQLVKKFPFLYRTE